MTALYSISLNLFQHSLNLLITYGGWIETLFNGGTIFFSICCIVLVYRSGTRHYITYITISYHSLDYKKKLFRIRGWLLVGKVSVKGWMKSIIVFRPLNILYFFWVLSKFLPSSSENKIEIINKQGAITDVNLI